MNGVVVLVSASFLCLVLGSVHAFSVFLDPLEQAFGAARSQVSLTYSMALAALTFVVLIGPRIYGRLPAAVLILCVCLVASLGTLVSAYAVSLPMIWFGYSLLFGAANGLGYGFGLQIAARANPGREGLAMGIVTACYAIGAAVSPFLFSNALAFGGFRAAMLGLSATMLAAAVFCTGLMHYSRATFPAQAFSGKAIAVSPATVGMLWLGYGAGVSAGLMVIGHASEIARSAGLVAALWLAPTLIALCNMTGSFAGGFLADRLPVRRLIVGLPVVTAAILLILQANTALSVAMASLGGVGFCYGAMISIYPSMIAKLFGMTAGPQVYGRVFTAWGLAGLSAPWLAGFLFDLNGSYALALMVAAGLSAISAVSALVFSRIQFRT